METIDNNLVKVTNEDLVNGYFEVPENILCIKSECFVSAKKLKKLFALSRCFFRFITSHVSLTQDMAHGNRQM